MTQPSPTPDDVRRLFDEASDGPWTVYPHPINSADDAVAELIFQVGETDPLADHLFLLNADGKCPAITGCGPSSEANARFIAAAREGWPADRERADRAEARVRELEGAAIKLALEAGRLNIALDGQEKYRRQRQAVVDAMDALRITLDRP